MASYYDEFLTLHGTLPDVMTATLNTIKKCDTAHKKLANELKIIIQTTNDTNSVDVDVDTKPSSSNSSSVKPSRRNTKVIDYNLNKKIIKSESESNAMNQESHTISDSNMNNMNKNKNIINNIEPNVIVKYDLKYIKSQSDKIQYKMQQMENLSTRKLQLCTQIYDLCDVHMKVGTKQLKIIENILNNKGIPIEIQTKNSLKRNNDSIHTDTGTGTDTGISKNDYNNNHKYHRNIVDIAEPTYCICNQVAYGDMVACENENCVTEWFHYKCVNLYKTPKSNWLCPTCAYEKKHKK